MRRRATLAAFAVAVLACWGAPAADASGIFQLATPQGCLVPSGAPCSNSGELTVPADILVTGPAVYVTAASVGPSQGGGVAIFDRDASTGALTRRSGPAGCIAETGNGTICSIGRGLNEPAGMAVSPDGTRLYVASPGSDAVATLVRDPATGALSQVAGTGGCIHQTGAEGCADGRGLLDPSRVALSPTGASLYVSGNSGSGSVTWLQTSAAGLTQEASAAACFEQVANMGADACTDLPDGHFQAGTGIAVSPDGEHVYAGSFGTSTVLTFDRTPATGAITPTGCLAATGTAGCTTAPELANEVVGMAFASSTDLWVTIRNVANGFTDGRLQRLDRNTGTGQLTPSTTACVSDSAFADTCAAKRDNMFTANDIAFSADGKTAVSVAPLDQSIVSFDRLATGVLATVPGDRGCLSFDDDPGCATLNGIDGPFAVDLSPDGRFVYVASQAVFAFIDGIGVFRRDTAPPVCSDGAVSGPAGQDITIPLACSDPDGDVIQRSIVQAPGFGSLGSIDQTAGTVTFSPGAAAGSTTVRFRGTAAGVASNEATVTIDVQAASGPGPQPTAAAAALARGRLKANKRGRVPVKLSCPAGSAGCAGNLTLRTANKVTVSAKRRLTLGSARYSLRAGETKTIRAKLKRKARRLLARRRRLGVTVILSPSVASVGRKTFRRTLTAPGR